MNEKKLIQALGFQAKDNTSDIFYKDYQFCSIEIDFNHKTINYGDKISAGRETTQNFSQAENWVVLECVNRLLEKGYKPENIILEKSFPAGRGVTKYLDILVTRDDGAAYLMIECKTWGSEFEKELKKIHTDGGQLFTYFQQDRDPELLMLYASQLSENNIVYKNTIINIEPEYRETSNVKDFYERWNKLPKQNGVFEQWVKLYGFESKALTIDDLVEIKSEDSSFIFNRFLEILRHNVVSDKGNAFNRIFTLFLCKIYDEKINEGTKNELAFQWFNAPFKYNEIEYEKDDHRTFQLRLTDLYRKGMHEFLEKVVTDFSETEFKNKFPNLSDDLSEPIINEFRKVRLEKNNEFAIKDVYDKDSFEDNAVVVKEIVELLQKYKLRYTKKQQYLSDFFELLLTTGLKQESGQFFTPVPIAQYVIKSLPIDKIVEEKLANAGISNKELLPYIMDYASGSGHFLTEMMHIIQSELNKKDLNKYHKNIAEDIAIWQQKHFSWAIDYIYGIEKDYRLVKVGKVGCYLHGDGLANVIHTDGLARFGHPDYKGKLLKKDNVYPKENKQFDIIVSNPPYSVSAFKNVARKYYTEDDFEIYNKLTDQSSEIECLFIERTKQLLKDGGVAGIILPSSILSNGGIYTKAREVILEYFDILGITELGSNTFMATGTNTVVLFLRRRSNYHVARLKVSVHKVFENKQDVTLNSIENAISKYAQYVWELPFADYKTLLEKQPNEKITEHDNYKEYQKKIKAKKETDLWQQIVETEQEKILYFVLTYKQKTVVVKTGQKNKEKQFLGYEFSNRRGSEGIHPIQRNKEIHECTKLFDEYCFDNPNKASTYNYKAFAENNFNADIPNSLKENIRYQNLVDMLTLDRADFEKTISLNAKKKLKIESQWEIVKIKDICEIGRGRVISKKEIEQNKGEYPVYSSQTSNDGIFGYLNTYDFEGEYATWTTDGIYAGSVFYRNGKFNCTNVCGTLKSKSKEIDMRYLVLTLPKYTDSYVVRVANPKLMNNVMADIQIPLPPLDIQKKIVSEIEALENEEKKTNEKIEAFRLKIENNSDALFNRFDIKKLGALCEPPLYGANEKAVERKTNEDYRYVRITDIDDNGNLNNDFKTVENIDEKYILQENDFLFARSGATAGKTFLYKNKYGRCLYAGYLIRFRVNKNDLNADYLNLIVKSRKYKNWVLENKQGSAQPNINAQQFSSFTIPLPSLSEQKKIVAEIEKIENQISKLENQIANIPMQKEEILKKYL